MNITVLNPSQFIKKEQHRSNDDRFHVKRGNIINMTAVMGFFREPLP